MDIATFCRKKVCLRNLMGEETNHHAETGKERARVLVRSLKWLISLDKYVIVLSKYEPSLSERFMSWAQKYSRLKFSFIWAGLAVFYKAELIKVGSK